MSTKLDQELLRALFNHLLASDIDLDRVLSGQVTSIKALFGIDSKELIAQVLDNAKHDTELQQTIRDLELEYAS